MCSIRKAFINYRISRPCVSHGFPFCSWGWVGPYKDSVNNRFISRITWRHKEGHFWYLKRQVIIPLSRQQAGQLKEQAAVHSISLHDFTLLHTAPHWSTISQTEPDLWDWFWSQSPHPPLSFTEWLEVFLGESILHHVPVLTAQHID